jgi:hypothetical protein
MLADLTKRIFGRHTVKIRSYFLSNMVEKKDLTPDVHQPTLKGLMKTIEHPSKSRKDSEPVYAETKFSERGREATGH